ncbi:MAG: hypothetical protein RIE08_08850 [Acidimicrobiales bacterium]
MSTSRRIHSRVLATLATLAVLAGVLALGSSPASAQSGVSPEGWLDRAEAVGGGVAIAGWALDRDAPAESVNVHVYVDGAYAAGRAASGARPDVNAARGVSGNHGFGWIVPAGPGAREVCVFALGLDAAGNENGDNPLLGCANLGGGAAPSAPSPSAPPSPTAPPGTNSPQGWLDRADGVNGGVAIAGWALDRDAPAKSVAVHVYVDGAYADGRTAAGARPDVNAALGVSGNHGFGWTVPASPGLREMCVFILGLDATGGQDGNNPLLGCADVVVASGGSPAAPGPAPAPAPSPSPAPAPPATGPTIGGSGTFSVGVDVTPGTYFATGTDGCYWARLSGFSGDFDDIIANDFGSGQRVVAIAGGDVGFETSRCGTWRPVSQAPANPAIGEGIWIVGRQMTPGTWRTNGGESCYWARLSGFSGDFDDIITNNIGDGPAVVTIAAGDVGFESSRCGTWTRVG